MANTLDAFVSNAGATTKVSGANALGKRVDESMVVTMQRFSYLLQNLARGCQLSRAPALFHCDARLRKSEECSRGNRQLGLFLKPISRSI
jgi:hypothetical protein